MERSIPSSPSPMALESLGPLLPASCWEAGKEAIIAAAAASAAKGHAGTLANTSFPPPGRRASRLGELGCRFTLARWSQMSVGMTVYRRKECQGSDACLACLLEASRLRSSARRKVRLVTGRVRSLIGWDRCREKNRREGHSVVLVPL